MLVETNNSVKDVDISYGKKYTLSEEEIKKIVENSQRIEGYEPASEAYELEIEVFMAKNNVKVSD
jgi:hypothetical protein